MGKLVSLAVALCLLAVTTACTGTETGGPAGRNGPGTTLATGKADDQPQTGNKTPDGKTIVKIGALVSKTGAGTPYGLSQIRGVQLGIEQLNERNTFPDVHFELVERDDGSNVAQAKEALNDLIANEGISALFGPTLSSVAAQVDRIAVAAGVPVFAISNTTLDILTVGEPFWRVALTDPSIAATNLTLVRDRFGVHQAGLVWDPNDRRSREIADRFRTAAKNAGVEISGEVAFSGGTQDLAPAVQQAQQLDVEALMIAATETDSRRFFDAVAQGRARLDFNIIGNSVWRVALSEKTMIPKSVAAAKAKRGMSRVVIVSDPNDPYSKGASDAMRAAATSEGMTVVDEVNYASGKSPDFSVAFADVTTRGANGFMVAALSSDASAFLQQRQAANQTGVPMVGGAGFATIELVKQMGPAAEGIIGGAAWITSRADEASQTFLREFTAAYQLDPDQWAALGYGGTQLLAAAMKAGNGTKRGAIRSGLAQLKDTPTVLGPITFSNAREAQYTGVVQTVRGDAFVTLE